MSREAAHSQVLSAVDVVVHLDRGLDGRRRVREIGVLARVGGEAQVATGVGFDPDGALLPGPGSDALTALVEP
jgi:pilus assembly protein CpaF